MKVIVGSTALEYFGFNRREPVDVDTWYDIGSPPAGDATKTPLNILERIPTVEGYATPDAVYTIKCSHLAWDIKWDKTKADILWLQSKGCVLLPWLYSVLKSHSETVHGDKSYLSLYKSKDRFFDDHVTYVYDHDYLHELVAYPNIPIYTKCLKEGESVMISKEKFFAMNYEDRVRMFKEEIVVIACERWLLNPHWKGKLSVNKAYKLSLKKTITSLTKNWANDFIVQNLQDFVKTDTRMFDHILNILGEQIMSTYAQINAAFEAYTEGDEGEMKNFIYALCEGDIYSDSLESAGLEYTHLEQEGGGEGGGEYCYGVFKLNDTIYKADYSYFSHEGHCIDDIEGSLRVVVAEKVEVTQYV